MLALPSSDELLAERCRRSLRTFVPQAWPLVEPGVGFVPNWHIDAICEHLEAVSRREVRRLIINVPPRHMKSLAVAVLWPCWEWLERPETKWLFLSYGQQLSTRDSLKCRRLIKTTGTAFVDPTGRTLLERVGYQGVLALLHGAEHWRISDDQDAKQKFDNTRMGYRLATSVGGTATGEGGDIIVIDDPHKADEAESDVVREGVLEWVDSTIPTRKNDPKRGAEVLIMQRLHERDLTGHLLDQGGWTHLCLPAEYEPGHPFVWPQDPRSQPGELLWPDRIGPAELSELKTRLGSYKSAGQLQQRPAPAEGGILKRAWWRWHHPDGAWPHFHDLIQSWDMAFKDTDGSDYVVGQVWGRFGADKYLVHQERARLEFTDTVHAVERLTEWVEQHFPRHRAHAKLVEDKANGPAVISALRRRIAGLIPVEPHGDKVARARAVAADVESGNVFLIGAPNEDGSNYDPVLTPRWVQEFVDEAAAFPNASHDDQVDACSQALLRLAGRGTRKRRSESKGRTVMHGVRSDPL